MTKFIGRGNRIILTLNGLPRPRSQSLPPKCAIKAICDLRRLRPPVHLTPEDERTLVEGVVLTREKCLRWVGVLKQFLDQRTLPPVSFLNLLTSWIDLYAKVERRRKKPRGWRWDSLRGFVHQERRLQSRKFLKNISRFAKSIAAHFNHPLCLLWGDYVQHSQPNNSSSNEPTRTVCEGEATRVFNVLKRIVVNGANASVEDYAVLKRYVSDQFQEPIIMKYLPDPRELRSLHEFVARAAAMDVYLQYLRIGRRFGFDQSYVRNVTTWLLKLGEPEARTQIEAIYRHFCRSFGG